VRCKRACSNSCTPKPGITAAFAPLLGIFVLAAAVFASAPMQNALTCSSSNLRLLFCINRVNSLQEVKDPRMNRTRDHKLIDILVVGVCCMICGGEGFTDMETFGKA
jgi:hypothetical protein